ncbi:AsmA-like C-terminal region-containing protein [Maribacter sp. 2304DJ31-5]|uniref:AsmA-like C-terminal region-containing protein n=1 Tax=Maribacter sp. 2304DJ31-5 TaxID=3386273 RepID=UPI0039BC6D9E
MKKKLIRLIGVVFLLIVLLLTAIPFFLESKIGDIIKNNVNNNLDATLDFSSADLSLLSSFPNAQVRLADVSLINKAPFDGDTLFFAKGVVLKMGIGELFKGSGTPISISDFIIDQALLHIMLDKEGNANYDIAKKNPEDTGATSGQSGGFSFNMESYKIKDTRIAYDDFSTGLHLEIAEMNHQGTGDLSLQTSELDTHTDALVSFKMGSTNYLNKNRVRLDALIGIDLNENKYSFLKNEVLVNQLPLVFNGFVKVNEDNQEVDISFKTPSSDFKNFLAVIPEVYSKNIENVKTTGNFVVAGTFKGVVDEVSIPKFNIKINADNASFKYPDLPKSVRAIFMDVEINNTEGIIKNTYLDLQKLSFMIDDDHFNMTSKITELLGNASVNASVDGNINLINISKAYPIPANLDLKGFLNTDFTTVFDRASVENGQYENTRTSGTLAVRDFEYNSEEINAPIKINTAALAFDPKTVVLNTLNGTMGKTDFDVTGTIDNFLGYLFNNEKVEGDFTLRSNVFALDDFMVEENAGGEKENQDTSSEEKIKIPSFLDANFNASANTVIYDNINLTNVRGNLKIKDEKAILSNMTSSLFNGKVIFDGEVSTENETPAFAMKLNMNQLQVDETFKSLQLFKVLAPVAQVLKGNFSSDITLSGKLTDNFTPDLPSLAGDVLANVLTAEINLESTPVLSALGSKLDFIDFDKLNLKELKTKLSFKDGLVSVKPFTINYRDIAINVAGGHAFDSNMNYKVVMEVPAKYLGNEVNDLIAKIDDRSLENITVPVTANIGGAYTSPEITTDLTSGIESLTGRLIEIQKQKFLNKGKSKVKDLIGDVLSGGKKDTMARQDKDSLKERAGDFLGDVLDNKKGGADTVPTKNDAVKEAAKDILGGLFKKKKDTAKAQKDSVN